MEIRTERLLLREFSDGDAPGFLAYHAEASHTEHYAPEEASPEHARELLRRFARWASERPRRNYQLAIAALQRPSQLLGCGGLRLAGLAAGTAELGLELAARHQGRGYAAEAAQALLGFGFRELGLAEVRGTTVSGNVRVIALARRLGWAEIARRPGPAWMRARGWSSVEWCITREGWESTQARVGLLTP